MRCAVSEAPALPRERVRIAMPNLARLAAWAGHDLAHVVVETPRGARAKLTFDPELKTFVLSKSLMLGLSYPYDWGFIPSTRAEDGDPLDAMVIHDAATTPGLVLRCKVIGVLQTIQKTKHNQIRNDRVIAVPKDSHRERELQGVGDLPLEVKEELEIGRASCRERWKVAVGGVGVRTRRRS